MRLFILAAFAILFAASGYAQSYPWAGNKLPSAWVNDPDDICHGAGGCTIGMPLLASPKLMVQDADPRRIPVQSVVSLPDSPTAAGSWVVWMTVEGVGNSDWITKDEFTTLTMGDQTITVRLDHGAKFCGNIVIYKGEYNPKAPVKAFLEVDAPNGCVTRP